MKSVVTFLPLLLCSVLNAQNPNFGWAKQLGGPYSDNGNSIITDDAGNVLTTGYFQGTADFNPDPAIANDLTSMGGTDIFISKLDNAGNFVWAKQIGGTLDDNGKSIIIIPDASGNVYVTGYFNGTLDFDPDPAVAYNLTSAGMQDIFIIKLNSSGNFIWAKRLGGALSDSVSGITVDGSGNVYTTGAFHGTADFNPDPSIAYNLTVPGNGTNVFISKLDVSGNFVWAKQLESISFAGGHSLALDASGNVYTCGVFYGTIDFNPDPAGIYNLTSKGATDVFIEKLDALGNFVWARQLGSTSPANALALVLDASANVYTSGTFSGTADFDPDPVKSNNLTSKGGYDIFVSKLNASGNFVWARQLGGAFDDEARGMAIDHSGRLYLTGFFYGTADFDPNPAVTYNLTPAGSYDIFISSLDAAGNFVWAKQTGGALADDGYAIAVNSSGNLYATGAFNGTVDFNPDPLSTYNLTSTGNTDIFLVNLSANNSTTNFISIANGNWSNPSIWSGGKVPSAGSVVIINTSVNVNANSSCYSLTINPSGSVTVNSGVNLKILN